MAEELSLSESPCSFLLLEGAVLCGRSLNKRMALKHPAMVEQKGLFKSHILSNWKVIVQEWLP